MAQSHAPGEGVLMDANEHAQMQALHKQLLDCRRQNAKLRAVLLHSVDCGICRMAWCPKRGRLEDQAIGRQRQTLRAP